jgi:hypothetical protein
MATRPRRLRNLNLEDEDDAEPFQEGHEDLMDNENDDNFQGPPDIDGLLARMLRYHPRSPIKIRCKFYLYFHVYSDAMSTQSISFM